MSIKGYYKLINHSSKQKNVKNSMQKLQRSRQDDRSSAVIVHQLLINNTEGRAAQETDVFSLELFRRNFT